MDRMPGKTGYVQYETLTGSEKAAILILALASDRVTDLLNRMGDSEVERILAAVARFNEIPATVLDRVLQEFVDEIGHHELAVHGGRERALTIIQATLESERADKLMEKLGRDERRVDWTLRAYTPEFIAEVLQDEHPQTIALVLSQIPAQRGSKVIASLPEEVRSEVVLRIASLESVSNDVVFELEEELAGLFERRTSPPTLLGGVEAAAKMLNVVPKTEGQEILEGVDHRDPEMAGEIRKRMLTFNDLVSIDKRGFQALLREIPTEDLVICLKTATEEMKEKVFSNVSSRAADQIREELELLPPMKLSEVERVQIQVVDTARRLEEEGSLTIDAVAGGEDALV